jgi:hypothetical protein
MNGGKTDKLDRLVPLSLHAVVSAAVRNMYSSLDERRDYLPFFTYRLFDKDISLVHGEFDSPHVVGRYLDALHRSEQAFGISAARDIVRALYGHLSRSLQIGEDGGDGLAWNEETGAQPAGAWGHNQREAMLGLIGAAKLLQDDRILDRAKSLVRGISKTTEHHGRFPSGLLTAGGWKSAGVLEPLPAQSGRLVRALLEYYRISGDVLAVKTAEEIAKTNWAACFDSEGKWTDAAGIHVHSIVGTITSAIDLALTTGNDRLLSAERAAFDVGARAYRSTFGWVQEMRGSAHERGEANNSGDILESAVLLARNVDPGYWDDAERILRNHLTRSQLTDTQLFHDSADMLDSPNQIYRGVATRAIGGFCFSSPTDFKSDANDVAPINTDLVGGATQAICEAYQAAVDDGTDEIAVNLLVDRSSGLWSIRSRLPQEGRLEIELKQAKRLRVRIPESAIKGSTRVTVNGESVRPGWSGQYIRLEAQSSSMSVSVEFDSKKWKSVEELNGREYCSSWVGDTVAGVDGGRITFKSLY